MKRKKRIRNKFAELEKEHGATVPIAQNFADELGRQLAKLLDEQRISLGFPMQNRVKTWESLRSKLGRKGVRISSVKELPDLIGLRIIVLFHRDLTRVAEILDDSFEVLQKEDTAGRLAESQFGYQSIHYIIQLPKEWFALPTLKGMTGLQAEVQIRTVAQHIWAASSHVLQYKNETSVPTALRRTIHRVSALLETVDLEFERVLEENEQYAATVKAPERNEELNVITLEKVLDDALPRKNKDSSDDLQYGELLEELRGHNIKTSGDLRKLLASSLPDLLKKDSKVAAAFVSLGTDSIEIEGHSFGIQPSDKPRVRKGVFYTHVGLARKALEHLKGQPRKTV
jgi:ppGpp synthetase/RelA/SpoT-type nucleotidyltranferase